MKIPGFLLVWLACAGFWSWAPTPKGLLDSAAVGFLLALTIAVFRKDGLAVGYRDGKNDGMTEGLNQGEKLWKS